MDAKDLAGKTVEITEGLLKGLRGVVEVNPLTSKTVVVVIEQGQGQIRAGDKVNLAPESVRPLN